MEPWFETQWAWLPGTAMGVLGGVWGALVGVFASRGRGRLVVTTMTVALLLAGATCMVAGLVALGVGQPYAVWYALLLPGVISLAVLGPLSIVARRTYQLHEQRQMQAQNF